MFSNFTTFTARFCYEYNRLLYSGCKLTVNICSVRSHLHCTVAVAAHNIGQRGAVGFLLLLLASLKDSLKTCKWERDKVRRLPPRTAPPPSPTKETEAAHTVSPTAYIPRETPKVCLSVATHISVRSVYSSSIAD